MSLPRDHTDGFVYGEGIVRSQEDCTSCGKVFVAKINYAVDGEHTLICSHCGHKHFRVIEKGVMTKKRWASQEGPNSEVPAGRMWSDKTVGIETNSAAEFIRRRWHGVSSE